MTFFDPNQGWQKIFKMAQNSEFLIFFDESKCVWKLRFPSKRFAKKKTKTSEKQIFGTFLPKIGTWKKFRPNFSNKCCFLTKNDKKFNPTSKWTRICKEFVWKQFKTYFSAFGTSPTIPPRQMSHFYRKCLLKETSVFATGGGIMTRNQLT